MSRADQRSTETFVEQGASPVEQPEIQRRSVASESLDDYERLLNRLATLAQAVGTAPDLNTIFRALRQFVVTSTPSSGLFASLYDPEAQLRTCVYAWSENEEIDVSTLPVMPMTDSPHSRAVATGEIIVTDDLQAALAGVPHFDLAFDIDPRPPRASMAVPMLVMGRVIGGFEIQSPELAAYGQEDIVAMRMAANLAAIAVENVRFRDRERELRQVAETSERRTAFLAEASEALSAALDYEATLARLARLVVPRLADWAFVEAPQADGSIRRLAMAHADPAKEALVHEYDRRYPADANAEIGSAKVIRTGQSELMRDIPEDVLQALASHEEHLRILRELGFTSAIIVPLRARGRTLGALALMSAESGRRYDEGDLQLAEELASRAALVADNARLYNEAQTAVREREALLSVASHELKNPLAGMLGYAQLLQSRMANNEAFRDRDRRAITAIVEQGERLNRMLDTLLDASRIETGRFHIDQQAIDLTAVVQRVVAEAQATLQMATDDDFQHTLTLHIEEQPLTVMGDTLRLEQALHNLIGNAIKYSPLGGPVTVRVERQAEEGVIAVEDRGLGIPAAAIPLLFQRFYRAHNSSGQHIQGLGIGLYVVREIVVQHGGVIDVASEEGIGSTFTIRLPLA